MSERQDQLPDTIDELIAFILTKTGNIVSDPGYHAAASAKIYALLVRDSFVPTLNNLSQELAQTRAEMHQASKAASRHARALVIATWVLAGVTALFFISSVIGF